MTQSILLLLGPDLSGSRAAGDTLADLMRAALTGTGVTVVQSGQEAELATAIDTAGSDIAGVVLDPGDLAPVAKGLADAIAQSPLPVYEVHAEPVHKADGHLHSLTANVATGTITGLGPHGYVEAARRIVDGA